MQYFGQNVPNFTVMQSVYSKGQCATDVNVGFVWFCLCWIVCKTSRNIW